MNTLQHCQAIWAAVEARRIALGWSKSELCRQSGVAHRDSYNAWINGRSQAHLLTVLDVCGALGITLELKERVDGRTT